jgi:hypothetical protein
VRYHTARDKGACAPYLNSEAIAVHSNLLDVFTALDTRPLLRDEMLNGDGNDKTAGDGWGWGWGGGGGWGA